MMNETTSKDPGSLRRRRRVRDHLLLFAISVGATVGLYASFAIPHPSEGAWIFRWSLATAYVASVLLAVTLSIGAWNLFRRRSSPISIDLRRDVGIWCGVFAIVHTLVGLNVHMKSWVQYFIDDAGGPRVDLFGLANYSGVLALVIVLVLLATSNDRSVSLLKGRRWKRVQRWSYLFAILVAFHAVLYIVVEKRFLPYLIFVMLLSAWVLIIQSFGIYKRTRFSNKSFDVKPRDIRP